MLFKVLKKANESIRTSLQLFFFLRFSLLVFCWDWESGDDDDDDERGSLVSALSWWLSLCWAMTLFRSNLSRTKTAPSPLGDCAWAWKTI